MMNANPLPRVMAVRAGAERPISAWAADAATATLLMAVALTLPVTLLLVAKLGYLLSLALTGLLIAGLLFGPTHGLLTVAAALMAYRLKTDPLSSSFGPEVLPGLLVALIAFVVGSGAHFLGDVRRRRGPITSRRSFRGEEIRRWRSAVADLARRRTFDFSWQRTLGAARVGLLPFALLGTATFAALLAREPLGAAASLQIQLAAVLGVAGLFGARYGFAAGVLGAVLLSDVALAGGPSARAPAALFTLIVFSAAGWGVGWLADQLQRKRSALNALLSASREISTTTDEAVIHRALFNSLTRLNDRGWVECRDDSGAICLSSASAPASARSTSAEGGEFRGEWRSRQLTADGRTVGSVRWRYVGAKTDVAIADEVAASLVDLGASAIVRARLSIEKSEMEFVARTEHLRTILLDAVSHHFRSPLAGILGSVTSVLTLPDEHDEQVRRELLLIIKEQANRLSRYVDNFLSVARLESGSIDMSLAEVQLEPLIYNVWDSFGEAGGARRFLQVHVDQEPVQADPGLLAQVLGNVLENAIKFSAEESIVDVRSRREGDNLVLEVTDQGVGVLPGKEDQIFRRFFRSPGAKAPGLGLGLYITRSLMEIQGGSVEARNRGGREPGLVVSLVLPLSPVSG